MDRTGILRSSLDLIYYSGAARACAGLSSAIGAIFMLHHVRPASEGRDGFAPNSGLEITPEFLDEVIQYVRDSGYVLVSLEEAIKTIASGKEPEHPIAVFTCDDGYRDNLEHAWPVFRHHDCPFTIFVAPQITDGTCELWWLALERVIAQNRFVSADLSGLKVSLSCETDTEKQTAFNQLYWPVRNLPEHAQRPWIRGFCDSYGLDLNELCRSEAMSWEELREISGDSLCSIGAHTIGHYAVSKLTEEQARAQINGSRDRIADELGRTPTTFAYPYGDAGSATPRDFQLVAEAGFEAAVTTRKGLIYSDHKDHLTALPRVSLNGGYQDLRYVEVLLSGAAFALWNKFRKVDAA